MTNLNAVDPTGNKSEGQGPLHRSLSPQPKSKVKRGPTIPLPKIPISHAQGAQSNKSDQQKKVSPLSQGKALSSKNVKPHLPTRAAPRLLKKIETSGQIEIKNTAEVQASKKFPPELPPKKKQDHVTRTGLATIIRVPPPIKPDTRQTNELAMNRFRRLSIDTSPDEASMENKYNEESLSLKTPLSRSEKTPSRSEKTPSPISPKSSSPTSKNSSNSRSSSPHSVSSNMNLDLSDSDSDSVKEASNLSPRSKFTSNSPKSGVLISSPRSPTSSKEQYINELIQEASLDNVKELLNHLIKEALKSKKPQKELNLIRDVIYELILKDTRKELIQKLVSEAFTLIHSDEENDEFQFPKSDAVLEQITLMQVIIGAITKADKTFKDKAFKKADHWAREVALNKWCTRIGDYIGFSLDKALKSLEALKTDLKLLEKNQSNDLDKFLETYAEDSVNFKGIKSEQRIELLLIAARKNLSAYIQSQVKGLAVIVEIMEGGTRTVLNPLEDIASSICMDILDRKQDQERIHSDLLEAAAKQKENSENHEIRRLLRTLKIRDNDIKWLEGERADKMQQAKSLLERSKLERQYAYQIANIKNDRIAILQKLNTLRSETILGKMQKSILEKIQDELREIDRKLEENVAKQHNMNLDNEKECDAIIREEIDLKNQRYYYRCRQEYTRTLDSNFEVDGEYVKDINAYVEQHGTSYIEREIKRRLTLPESEIDILLSPWNQDFDVFINEKIQKKDQFSIIALVELLHNKSREGDKASERLLEKLKDSISRAFERIIVEEDRRALRFIQKLTSGIGAPKTVAEIEKCSGTELLVRLDTIRFLGGIVYDAIKNKVNGQNEAKLDQIRNKTKMIQQDEDVLKALENDRVKELKKWQMMLLPKMSKELEVWTRELNSNLSSEEVAERMKSIPKFSSWIELSEWQETFIEQVEMAKYKNLDNRNKAELMNEVGMLQRPDRKVISMRNAKDSTLETLFQQYKVSCSNLFELLENFFKHLGYQQSEFALVNFERFLECVNFDKDKKLQTDVLALCKNFIKLIKIRSNLIAQSDSYNEESSKEMNDFTDRIRNIDARIEASRIDLIRLIGSLKNK